MPYVCCSSSHPWPLRAVEIDVRPGDQYKELGTRYAPDTRQGLMFCFPCSPLSNPEVRALLEKLCYRVDALGRPMRYCWLWASVICETWLTSTRRKDPRRQ
eukprot:1315948-Amorphochlora_amoeboformis.AAC.1